MQLFGFQGDSGVLHDGVDVHLVWDPWGQVLENTVFIGFMVLLALNLEGNPTVVWIFRSRNENLFRLASLLGALPAHLVGGHTGGGGGHPANLPGLLLHPEVCRSQGPGGEAARQRGGAGLCLASKGSGQVLNLVRTIFSRIWEYFLSITWTPYFSPVPTMSGSFEKLKVFLSFPATKYSAEYESAGASIVNRYLEPLFSCEN